MLSRHHALRYQAWPCKIPHHIIHWGRVAHIFVSKLTIIHSDNGLSPDWHQAIIRTNAEKSLIRTFSETQAEFVHFHSKMHFKMSSAKCLQFCLGINVLRGEKRPGVIWHRYLKILPQIRPGPTYSTYCISWLLMSWRRKEPGHQQPCYWPS